MGWRKACATCRLRLGKDFNVVTVSFDPRETPELAAAKKKTYVGQLRAARRRRGLALPHGQGPRPSSS